jgi:hypothetical protein
MQIQGTRPLIPLGRKTPSSTSYWKGQKKMTPKVACTKPHDSHLISPHPFGRETGNDS